MVFSRAVCGDPVDVVHLHRAELRVEPPLRRVEPAEGAQRADGQHHVVGRRQPAQAAVGVDDVASAAR